MKKNNEIIKAINALNNKQIVCFKTDTIYGLSCNALDDESCKRINEIKDRENKPYILLIGKNTKLQNYVEKISENAEKLIKKYWPGPLTLVFKSKYKFNEYISCGQKTIALRMAKGNMCEKILDNLEFPIVSTSVNRHGEKPLDNYFDIVQNFGDKIDIIVSSKNNSTNMPSTIVDVTTDEVVVLREGIITIEKINKTLGVI